MKVLAIISGLVQEIRVRPGEPVKVNQVLIVLEAMKMELQLVSPVDGFVTAIRCKEGQDVSEGDWLATVD